MLTVNHLTKLLQIAILAAITYVLTLISIPIIPIAPYLKLDLSDLPILVGTVMLGANAGFSIAILSIFLHLLTNGFALPVMLGDAVMLIAAIVTVVTMAGLVHFFSKDHLIDHKMLLVIIITVNLTVAMALINTLAIPLEMKILGMTIRLPVIKIIIFGVIPFNVVKGIVVTVIFLFVDRYLRKSKRV